MMALWSWCPFRRPRRLNSGENLSQEPCYASETPHHELQGVGGDKAIEISQEAYQPILVAAGTPPESRRAPCKPPKLPQSIATDGVTKRSGKSSANKFNRFSLPAHPHSSSALEDIPEHDGYYVKSNPALNDPEGVDLFDDNVSFHTARMHSSRDLHSFDHEVRILTEKLEEEMEKAEQERKKQHDKLKDMISGLGKKLEQERKKQHDELKEMISDLVKKVESMEKEPVTASTAAVDPQSPISGDVKMNASMLPQSCAVSTDVLLSLATITMPKWKFLARYLHLQESEIQQISAENPSNVQEQTYQMLLKWNQSQTQNNDHYHVLGEAVRKAFGERIYVDYIKMVIDVEGILSSQ